MQNLQKKYLHNTENFVKQTGRCHNFDNVDTLGVCDRWLDILAIDTFKPVASLRVSSFTLEMINQQFSSIHSHCHKQYYLMSMYISILLSILIHCHHSTNLSPFPLKFTHISTTCTPPTCITQPTTGPTALYKTPHV